MQKLTQKQVNKMSKFERKNLLDKFENLMCNTDYTTIKGEIEYSIYAHNAELLISKNLGEF